MMYSKRHLPDMEQWSQSSGSNVIPRRARPGLAGLRPHRPQPPNAEQVTMGNFLAIIREAMVRYQVLQTRTPTNYLAEM